MLANLLFVLIIISGAVYLTARCDRRFEEMLPISVMSMVLLLFFFGLAGQLAAGVTALFAVSAALYADRMVFDQKKRDLLFFEEYHHSGICVFYTPVCWPVCMELW